MIHIEYPAGKRPFQNGNDHQTDTNKNGTQKWIEKAEALTKRLLAAADKSARDKIIDENSHVWGELKEWLESFSHGKCWFTESRAPCFHWQVEHFRPKKKTKEPDRDGYWWLAFDFLNFRLCGSVTNSKKGCYFPLREETAAAFLPIHNCDDEACVLIDPTRQSDVALLDFSSRGGEAFPASADGWERLRATKSIERYNLNHPPLKRARERVWNMCTMRIEELKRKLKENLEQPSPARTEQIERLCIEIKEMTRRESEFSATARDVVLKDENRLVRRLIA